MYVLGVLIFTFINRFAEDDFKENDKNRSLKEVFIIIAKSI